jgi:DNA modification methylase
MKVETKKITELIPDPKNARKHSKKNIDAIKKSLSEFGQQKPIVISKDFVIVAGNGFAQAAKELGWENISVVQTELQTDEARAYAIADNRTAELAEWDEENLTELLKEVYDSDIENISTGFTDKEIQKLFSDSKEIEEDEVPEVEEKAVTKVGDLWLLGNHRLLCGDATNENNFLKLINKEKVNIIFTDPPYGINVVKNDMVGADFGVSKKGKYKKIVDDDTTDTAKHFFEICNKLLNCNKLIFWGGNYFGDFLPNNKNWLIWNKRAGVNIRNTFADGEMAWCSFNTPVRIYDQLWNGMIREGEKEKRIHPTQKPTRMLGEIILDFTEEKDLVFDGFLGSGSTLIACEQLNRNCYGMEIDPLYCDVIIKRWENLTGKKAKKG